MIVRESLEFRRGEGTKRGLRVGSARYRDNHEKMIEDLTNSIQSEEDLTNAIFPANFRITNDNPWGHEQIGNFTKRLRIQARSGIFQPRPIDNRIFKGRVRNWIKEHTDFKIVSFSKVRSQPRNSSHYLIVLE